MVIVAMQYFVIKMKVVFLKNIFKKLLSDFIQNKKLTKPICIFVILIIFVMRKCLKILIGCNLKRT